MGRAMASYIEGGEKEVEKHFYVLPDNRPQRPTRQQLEAIMGELLAEMGCSQHQIMAIMSHTQAKTSEIYTKGAERRVLATGGMQALATLDW